MGSVKQACTSLFNYWLLSFGYKTSIAGGIYLDCLTLKMYYADIYYHLSYTLMCPAFYDT